MKKMLSLAAILVAGGFLLTACGGSGNKLTCTSEESLLGNKADIEVVISFDGDKVSKMSGSMTFEDEAFAKTIAEGLKQLGDDAKKASLSVSGKTLKIGDMIEFNKLQGEDFDLTGVSKDEAKKQLEDAGFKCN